MPLGSLGCLWAPFEPLWPPLDPILLSLCALWVSLELFRVILESLGVTWSPSGTILGVLLVLLRALSDHLRGNLGSTRRYHAFHMVYDFVLVSFGV